MSTSTDNQIFFWETTSGRLEKSGAAVRDVVWYGHGEAQGGADDDSATSAVLHPWRSPLGWPVAGLWTSRSRGSSGNLSSDLQREVTALQSSPSLALCAFGDGLGRMSLMRFPVPLRRAQVRSYHGHGERVTNVCWNSESVVVSTAGADGVMLQWRLSTEKVSQHTLRASAATGTGVATGTAASRRDTPLRRRGSRQSMPAAVGGHVPISNSTSPSRRRSPRPQGTPAAPTAPRPRSPQRGAHASAQPGGRSRGQAAARAATPVPTLKTSAAVAVPKAQECPAEVGGPLNLVSRSTQTELQEQPPAADAAEQPAREDVWDVVTWTGSDASSTTVAKDALSKDVTPVNSAVSFQASANCNSHAATEATADDSVEAPALLEKIELLEMTSDTKVPPAATSLLGQTSTLDALEVRSWLRPGLSPNLRVSPPGTVIYMPESGSAPGHNGSCPVVETAGSCPAVASVSPVAPAVASTAVVRREVTRSHSGSAVLQRRPSATPAGLMAAPGNAGAPTRPARALLGGASSVPTLGPLVAPPTIWQGSLSFQPPRQGESAAQRPCTPRGFAIEGDGSFGPPLATDFAAAPVRASAASTTTAAVKAPQIPLAAVHAPPVPLVRVPTPRGQAWDAASLVTASSARALGSPRVVRTTSTPAIASCHVVRASSVTALASTGAR